MRESSVLVVAVLSLILSVVAVFIGLSGRRAAAGMDTRMVDVENRLGMVQKDTSRVDSQIQGLFEQTQRAMAALKTDIVALQARSATPTNTVRTSSTTSSTTGTATGTGAPAPAAPGTYKIKAGDSLYEIAKKLNKPLEAIIKANPGIDPRRMKIGATIKIP